jgi:hypothetical protein
MGILDGLLGCSHKKLGFPISIRGAGRRTEAASLTGTYIVCLDCGHEFPYDWNKMKVIRKAIAPPSERIIGTVPRSAA